MTASPLLAFADRRFPRRSFFITSQNQQDQMSNFQQKDLSGSLFKNEDRKSDKECALLRFMPDRRPMLQDFGVGMARPRRCNGTRHCGGAARDRPGPDVHEEALPLRARKNWIDSLAESGKKHAAAKTPPKPRPKIERIVITTRPSDPGTGDPGSARIGHF
jgi:hypothetical protein